jgi:hypothetical protein
MIHPSARFSIFSRVAERLSTVSNISSSSPRCRILSMAVSGSMSTKTLTSGIGRMMEM